MSLVAGLDFGGGAVKACVARVSDGEVIAAVVNHRVVSLDAVLMRGELLVSSGADGVFPAGIPVATVGLDAARNAGILAAQIVSTASAETRDEIIAYKEGLTQQVLEKSERVKTQSV